ncbi:MAG: dihydroxy-acid dehydratase, partial [Clostridia bacterium]|nr:dihydroxy-acid dehydratase [Clostridia bacterium]
MRSDNVLKGAERAPNRSLFYAMGYTKEELERPLIGVVCAHSEIVPGHIHLDKIADAVKAGIRMAGGKYVVVHALTLEEADVLESTGHAPGHDVVGLVMDD